MTRRLAKLATQLIVIGENATMNDPVLAKNDRAESTAAYAGNRSRVFDGLSTGEGMKNG